MNRLFLFPQKGLKLSASRIFKLSLNIANGNILDFKKCDLYRTSVSVTGTGNQIIGINALVNGSVITINGNNNKLILEQGVKLRKGFIQIRGNGCSVMIGGNTTFGQIRIVNVGKNNPVSIGSNCLFADDIEIWASDTHSIYDENGKFINPEKPVKIGDRVWVGSHVRILKGVSVGDGAIIGMSSVVTKNVESKTLNAGNPLQLLKTNITWTLNYQNNPL